MRLRFWLPHPATDLREVYGPGDASGRLERDARRLARMRGEEPCPAEPAPAEIPSLQAVYAERIRLLPPWRFDEIVRADGRAWVRAGDSARPGG